MAEEVRIDLKSTADTSGADKMGAAIGGLEGKSKGAAAGVGAVSKESKDMAQNMGRGIEVGNATTALMQNLGNASKGGAEGMFAAARATASFAQVVKGIVAGAGPIGIAIAAIGLLGGAIFALKEKFSAPKRSIDDFKNKLAEIDSASMKQIDATVGALADRLKAAKEEADAVRQSMDMIDDAEMGAKLAANKASGLDDKEKLRQEFLIRDEFKARKQAREKEAAELAVSQANETRDALAPEFADKRDAYIGKLTEMDANRSLAKDAKAAFAEAFKLEAAISGAGDVQGRAAYKRQLELARSMNAQLPSAEGAAKMDAEFASAKEAFQGKDGNGGISARYQAAVDAAEKSDKALRRLLTTREEVDKWDKARVRLENGGIDPRDAEAAARTSPGRARTIGPDGAMREYDVGAAPTINQGITAAAEAARVRPLAGLPNTMQAGGGKLPGDGQADGTKIQVNAKPLEKGLKESNDKARAAIDAELAKVAAGVAAQSVSLTSTIAATATIAAAQTATAQALEQLKSQISNMRQSR